MSLHSIFSSHPPSSVNSAEIVSALEEAMTQLFRTFRDRNNGRLPLHIVVYRDGVDNGRFAEVLDRELPCIRSAINSMVKSYVLLNHL